MPIATTKTREIAAADAPSTVVPTVGLPTLINVVFFRLILGAGLRIFFEYLAHR